MKYFIVQLIDMNGKATDFVSFHDFYEARDYACKNHLCWHVKECV